MFVGIMMCCPKVGVSYMAPKHPNMAVFEGQTLSLQSHTTRLKVGMPPSCTMTTHM